MSLLAASVATSATSQSINTGSLTFSPIITLDSPNASIKQETSPDQSSQLRDTSSSATARATSTITPFGGGGGEDGATPTGTQGLFPSIGLASNRSTQGSGPFTLGGDLVTQNAQAPGLLDGTNGLLVMGALAIAAFFVVRRFL